MKTSQKHSLSRAFPRNPQHSSSSQDSTILKSTKRIRMMKGSRIVEKSSKNGHKPIVSKRIENPQDIHNSSQACGKQVYASIAVAESSAEAMLRMGFLKTAHVEKCGDCGLVHIREVLK